MDTENLLVIGGWMDGRRVDFPRAQRETFAPKPDDPQTEINMRTQRYIRRVLPGGHVVLVWDQVYTMEDVIAILIARYPAEMPRQYQWS